MQKCSKCKIIKEEKDFWKCSSGNKKGLHSWCKNCQRQDAMRRYFILKEKNPEKIKHYAAKWRENNRDRARFLANKSYQKIRYETLCVYGGNPPKCACCGEKNVEFLSFDHINGGGLRHQKKEKYVNLMRWLKNNKYPKGFRVLCHNCNFSNGHYGYCPHKKESI